MYPRKKIAHGWEIKGGDARKIAIFRGYPYFGHFLPLQRYFATKSAQNQKTKRTPGARGRSRAVCHATAERSGGAHPLGMVSGLTLAIAMVEPVGRVVHTFLGTNLIELMGQPRRTGFGRFWALFVTK